MPIIIAAQNERVTGCKISPGAPAVTHLLFADDSFLFFKANETEAQNVKYLLNLYEQESGQAVNFQKSGIFFSSNVRRDKQSQIANIMGVHNDLREGRYLGLPSLIGRSRKKVFNFVKERVWKKIQGWSNCKVSKAGKLVLLKNVAQSIPSHCMSCFLLPKSLSLEIERMFNGFWWKSGKSDSKGIRWLSWENMCMAKDKGGLGFRSLQGYNMALIGKLIWQFMTKPDSLVARIYKARYYPNNHVLEAQKSGDASFIWSGICEVKEELRQGFKWVLGDGKSIKIFTDQWLRGKNDYRVENHHINSSRDDKVADYFRPDIKQWDVTKIQQTFHTIDVDCILNTRVPYNQIPDRIAWMHTKDGSYTAKSGYHFWADRKIGERGVNISNGWRRIWQIAVPHKMKVFMWRLCKNNIPVRNLLKGRGVSTPIICPVCNVDVEHTRHLFLECPFARSCWIYTGGEYDTTEVEYLSDWVL